MFLICMGPREPRGRGGAWGRGEPRGRRGAAEGILKNLRSTVLGFLKKLRPTASWGF